ncbi:ribosome small subunit-dependent GTPase A [Edaphobacillus lindanitolerans]|uniref:Small ribosomal subunit biogenesis GTPase RsgA n=1 Tax=Edaphobacillus lindanitolerans TaxID=550447 RepID=A0A1U7PHG7_9BACI|nr:ribosome small subunit-dependent GTPase A [Edaphobacillus lindanitolerans]SIT67592.1 ribosome biogenesis GTPase [Edaphobacillus lindanitolerans]
MENGQIRKALSGFYYVYNDGRTIRGRGRGVFRNQGVTPLVGDFVDYEVDGDNDAVIMGIHERKNELVRPPIANVDQALLVFSMKEPDFSPRLLDRFLTVIESYGVDPIICLTKADLLDDGDTGRLRPYIDYYSGIGYPVIETRIGDADLAGRLQPFLEGKTTVLTGQSGVGKSTLLNSLMPELELKTDEISDALGRGRHTTRHVELIEYGGGLVADTPGFSSLDFDHLEKEDLPDCFIEFAQLSDQCKFRGCLHLKEPKCAVKAAVESGAAARFRYDDYVLFMQEIIDRKPRYSS